MLLLLIILNASSTPMNDDTGASSSDAPFRVRHRPPIDELSAYVKALRQRRYEVTRMDSDVAQDFLEAYASLNVPKAEAELHMYERLLIPKIITHVILPGLPFTEADIKNPTTDMSQHYLEYCWEALTNLKMAPLPHGSRRSKLPK
ncbi:hypothetical protein SeMB42_g01803, partial [Synchytrium endobioticum]